MTVTTQEREAADFLARKISRRPEVGVILGTGLGGVADEVQDAERVHYTDIPGFPETTAPTHKGNFVFGELSGKSVVLMQGRYHTYEGYDQKLCTLPVAVMHRLGVKTLIVSAAAGGLNRSQVAGDFMVIRDHINFTGSNPLVGPNDDSAGPRFPVMFDCYDPALRELAHAVALEAGFRLHEGVYCGITGPVFFTRAELRMLMQWGADSIGMSTVPEVIVAVHRGLKVLGLACISDMALPDGSHHADEAEVLNRMKESGLRFTVLLKKILERMS